VETEASALLAERSQNKEELPAPHWGLRLLREAAAAGGKAVVWSLSS